MKKIPKKALWLILMLLVSSASFADIPDPNDDPISDEDPPPPAPIDSSITVLILAGAGLACYQLHRKAAKQQI